MRRNLLWIFFLGWLVIPSSLTALVGGLQVSNAKIISDSSGAYAEFLISATAPPLGDIEFTYITSNGSAKSGVEYVGTSGKSLIKSGQLRTKVKIPLLQTSSIKSKDFYLTISASKVSIFTPTGRAQLNTMETHPVQSGASHETH